MKVFCRRVYNLPCCFRFQFFAHKFLVDILAFVVSEGDGDSTLFVIITSCEMLLISTTRAQIKTIYCSLSKD